MWKWVARGMRADLRARWPLYLSDWRDGLHIRVLAAIVFMYFTSLLPALAFANYLIDKTSGHLGVVEIILTMGMGGVLYALFCGQPLVIIGITGPISIFLDTVYSVSSSLKLPFFPFLTWIGLWTALFHVVLALSNACTLIKYATRFSGETFGVLIAIIYLVEGISDIVKYFDRNGTEGGLLSLVLAMAMFLLAMFLSNARTWNILHTVVRSYILADYAVAIAIFSITAAPFLPSFDPVSIEYLPVPHAFRPTRDRAWFVPFWRIEGWGIALAVLPALLLTTLFFFDHNISSYLSQLKRFKLRKPSAYHWDFFVLGLCAVPSALLGLPLNNGLIPQAPLHVRSVASIKEEVVDGYTQETYKRVYENRISPFAQSLLIGLTLLPGVLPLLGNIPRPVLSGLFIYMSITSLDGNEFFERVKFLMTWERRRWPRKGWAQKMPFSVTSLFTLIQLFCLGTVYGITRTPKAAMAFPVFILLLVPLRFLVLPCFFSAAHLRLLDGDEEAAADEGASSTAPTLNQLAPPGKTASEIL